MSKLKILTNGLIKENPVLILLLGTCPVLAVSTSVLGAVGMGLAATFVLVGSNFVISLLKNVIPSKVRIPCFIVVIAGFVTIVQLLLQAYLPDIYSLLGIYLPLIVVNCIILGRAEMFASKNSAIDSVIDGIGMGIGFTLALMAMATIREIIGSGTWFGISLTDKLWSPIGIMVQSPGGFLTYGCLIALMNKLSKVKGTKKPREDCASCPAASFCASQPKGGC